VAANRLRLEVDVMTTREMAVWELEGRWSFPRVEGGVLVRDAALVRALLQARAAVEGTKGTEGTAPSGEPLDARIPMNV
jgi:hypothetical protein